MNVSGVRLTDEQVAFLKRNVARRPDFGDVTVDSFVPVQILRAVYDALPVSDE